MGSQANLGSIPAAFDGKVVLLTGANGFFGQALLERFLSGPFKPAKLYCLIRAPLTPSRLPPHLSGSNFPYVEWVAGDPAEPLLGLEPEKYWELLESVDVVINGAANTKFRQSRMDSVGSNVTIAFQIASFAYNAKKLALLVHLSTTYVGVHLPKGTAVPEGSIPPTPELAMVNQYVESKMLSEGIFTAFSSRPTSPTSLPAFRTLILRLSVLGPAARFPEPGWMLPGSNSSPVLLALRANRDFQPKMGDYEALENRVDCIPVDVAVNQVLGQIAYHSLNTESPVGQPLIRNIAHGLDNAHVWSEWMDINVRFLHNVHDIPIPYAEAMLLPLMRDVCVDTRRTRGELERMDGEECGPEFFFDAEEAIGANGGWNKWLLAEGLRKHDVKQ